MFRLTEELARWRATLVRTGRFSTAQVDELVDHLDASIAEERARGLDERSAFAAATTRLGGVTELAAEYSTDRPARALIGRLANAPIANRLLGAYLLAVAASACIGTAYGYWIYASGRMAAPDTVPLLFAVSVVAVFAWSGLQGWRTWLGRPLGSATLLGLLALMMLQVPIFGGSLRSHFEFSGGLQLAVLLARMRSCCDSGPA